MNNDPRLIDQESRRCIKEIIDENYFVEAGAGSGKTTVLVQRMIKMIEEGKDIANICAITFTKAAANEFYERFQKELIDKSLSDSIHKDKYLYALNNIDLAFMGTIDSFCNMIMSEHPSEGLIPSNSIIIDEDRATKLYKTEYSNILNGLYNDDNILQLAKDFIRYDNYPEDLFILTLKSIINHRDCELVIPNYSNENIDIKFKDEIQTVRKTVNVLCQHPEFITSANQDDANLVAHYFETYKHIFNGSWNDNIPNLLNAYNKTFNNKKFRLVLDSDIENYLMEGIDYFIVHEGRGKWYEINPDKLPKIFGFISDNKYALTLDFVYRASKLILSKLRKEGQLTFTDYLVYLRDTLRNDAKNGGRLIRHIYDRHKYFLIDEFQDTDPIQAQIFFYLAAEKINEDWKKCIPYKGSLFIVGDPKQSIYRFKNADVASYLEVQAMFVKPVGEVLHLYNNFRSTYQIKEWFNNTFNKLLVNGNEQAQFENIPLDESNKYDGISRVYKYNVPFKAESEQDKDEYKVTNIILKLYKNDDYKISEVNKKDGKASIVNRTLDYKDFMIITPSKVSLANYTKLFREYGIPYYVEGNIVFKESKAFEVFVNFYNAICNKHDNRYLYSVLKSKLFNISEKQLIEARNAGFSFNLGEEYKTLNLSKDLCKALDVINQYAFLANKYNPSSLFNMIINNIDGFKAYGNENMEYVYFALELLKSKQNSNEIITNIDAADFLNSLLLSTNDIERCPGFSKEANLVHLANLHKVKGLEAPVVILAHPRTNARTPSFRMVRDGGVNKGYLFEVKKKLEKSDITVLSSDRYDDPYKNDEQESMNQEKQRLSYVAATRAKNILIISNLDTKSPSKSNPWTDLLNANSEYILNDIELELNKYRVSNKRNMPIQYESISQNKNILLENNDVLSKMTYTIANPSKLVNIDTDLDVLTQNQIEESHGDTLATITGTIIHRLMELIICSKDKLNKQSLIDNIINEYINGEFINNKQYFINVLDDVYETIHNGGYIQKGKVNKDILPIILNADNVECEVQYTYLDDNNKLWNGIIDLVYEYNNELHIIDWKTNINDDNLDEHYKLQLESYIKAIEKTTDKKVVDALIYHIKHI